MCITCTHFSNLNLDSFILVSSSTEEMILVAALRNFARDLEP